jgi:all-trans-8'-apo-beta-carotenal 15,15'-oxygenase
VTALSATPTSSQRPSWNLATLGDVELHLQPSPLVGGPSWLPLHCKLLLRGRDDDRREDYGFDFVPQNATTASTLVNLLRLRSVPGTIRSVATTSSDHARTDARTRQAAETYVRDYDTELHLVRNNCWTFALGLAWYLVQQHDDDATTATVLASRPVSVVDSPPPPTTTTPTGEPETTDAFAKDVPQPWILNPLHQKDYDQDRDWGFVYSSVPPEAESSYDCNDIQGAIPADLVGTYYKIGGGRFERGGQRYAHVLDGDGFVASFRIQTNGRVRYTGRFVETEYFQKEQARDEICYRNVFGTQRQGGPLANAFDLTLKNVANTNILPWGDRLFALWEAGRPYELDPVSLETLPPTPDGPFTDIGEIDCSLRGVTLDEGGPLDRVIQVGRFFTAHPHIVDDDTLVAFTAALNPPTNALFLEFLEYDAQWNVKQRTPYQVPACTGASHDFSVGTDYYAFIQNRLESATLPYLLGLSSPTQAMQLQIKQGALLHLVPRREGVDAVQVEIPPYFAIHNLASIKEDGDHVTIYTNGWDLQDETYFPKDQNSVPFLGSWSGQYPDFDYVPPAKFYSTTVNRQTGKLISHEQVVPGLVMEFQTQDERSPEITYMAASTTGGESLPGVGYAKVNTTSGLAEYWWAEPKIFTGELLPVAKQNGDQGSWLLGLLYDATQRRTSLGIMDSERFSEGPIARVHLTHHISYGLHSSFSRTPVRKIYLPGK